MGWLLTGMLLKFSVAKFFKYISIVESCRLHICFPRLNVLEVISRFLVGIFECLNWSRILNFTDLDQKGDPAG